MNSLWKARKGTTLVEILVVMVVLLVGIMTVITMFPTGFRVVRAAESQTIATKLAQAEVERWKNMPGNLPDAILPLDFSNAIINDQDPGPGFEGMMPTTVTGQYYPGNAGNFRWVRNETTPIPVGSYFQTGGGALYGSRYNLAFAPIEVELDPGKPGQYLGLSVKSGDLQRRVGDSQDRIFLRRGQYGVDYTLGTSGTQPCFYVCFSYDQDPSHIYHVSYSYTVSATSPASDTQYLSTVDQTVNPSATGDWVAVPITAPAGYDVESVEEGSDSCARGFMQVVNNWSNDPYEFTLADSILGIVAFNPLAHNALERTARGVRAVTARIDYRIYDPRIIREERVVAALNEDLDGDPQHLNDHTQIKLALRFILDSGDPTDVHDGDATDNPDEPTFEGLVKQRLGMEVNSSADLAIPQAMLIIDLATGLRVEMPGGSIDFKNGIVHLPERANLIDWSSLPVPDLQDVLLQGRHLKFFYRADGDWSVQCQKAYSYYLREYGANPVDYREFKLIQDGDGLWKLLFARCMSGQSVAVDYTYTDAGGVIRKVSGKNLRLSDDVIPDGGNLCSYVVLGPSGTAVNPSDRIIVVGTSFRSRVIWRDGRAWRYVDIDTNLTRNSTP